MICDEFVMISQLFMLKYAMQWVKLGIVEWAIEYKEKNLGGTSNESEQLISSEIWYISIETSFQAGVSGWDQIKIQTKKPYSLKVILTRCNRKRKKKAFRNYK